MYKLKLFSKTYYIEINKVVLISYEHHKNNVFKLFILVSDTKIESYIKKQELIELLAQKNIEFGGG